MQQHVAKVEDNLQYAATRTVVALFHGTVGSLAEPADILPEHLKELQTLGIVSYLITHYRNNTGDADYGNILQDLHVSFGGLGIMDKKMESATLCIIGIM